MNYTLNINTFNKTWMESEIEIIDKILESLSEINNKHQNFFDTIIVSHEIFNCMSHVVEEMSINLSIKKSITFDGISAYYACNINNYMIYVSEKIKNTEILILTNKDKIRNINIDKILNNLEIPNKILLKINRNYFKN